jgi:hypothetical protein
LQVLDYTVDRAGTSGACTQIGTGVVDVGKVRRRRRGRGDQSNRNVEQVAVADGVLDRTGLAERSDVRGEADHDFAERLLMRNVRRSE